MITLVHGSDIDASRKIYIDLKKTFAGRDFRSFDSGGIDKALLMSALESPSMFSSQICIAIENLISSYGRKTKELGDILSVLTDPKYNDVDIFLWEKKEIGKAVQSKLKHAKILVANTPADLFRFLDAVFPGNFPSMHPLYRSTLKSIAPELVLFMLERRARELMMVKDGFTPEGTAPWQVDKLTKQASRFSMEQLAALYRKLLHLDYAMKSGGMALPLENELENILVLV